MNQILTFSSYRIQLQNTVIKIKNARLEVKSAIAAEKKKTLEIIQKYILKIYLFFNLINYGLNVVNLILILGKKK